MAEFHDEVNTFLSEASSKGYDLQHSQVRFDGSMVRFPIGKSKDAGWLVAYDNLEAGGKRRPVIVYGDWKSGEKYTFIAGGKDLSDGEHRAIRKKIAEEKDKQVEAKKQTQEEVAKVAQSRWEAGSNGASADTHPYIIRKGIKRSYGMRVDANGNLMVPMGVQGSQGICGIQSIDPDGNKYFMTGQRFKGAHIILGEVSKNEEMYLCEGYATGASIHEATGRSVIIAFSAGNLRAVAEQFDGYKITVCGDDDRFTKGNPGKKAADQAAKILKSVAIYPIFTEENENGTDFNDYHCAYGLPKLAELFARVHERPECEFKNFEIEEYEDEKGKIKTKIIPLTAKKMWDTLEKIAGSQIKRVDHQVFTVNGTEIMFHIRSESFLAWLGGQSIHPNFVAARGAVSKPEFLSFVGQNAHNYAYLSRTSQFPIREDIFCPGQIAPQHTGKLNELLDFFLTKDEAHKDLLRSAFCTPFWSGDGGTRPAFVFDGLDDDVEKNRGIGKTTISEVISTLAGGYIDLSSKADIDEIKKRMLTSEFRIGRFDNIKTLKLSSEALESLITTQWVSGHKMYVGDVRVPNIFTYMLTFNGASFSKDMAQRCVIVRLRRPNKTNEWMANLKMFIEKNREAVIADIGFYLTKAIEFMPSRSRFPQWETGVMQRCDRSGEAITAMLKEQSEVDDDARLVDEIFDFFSAKISEYKKGSNTTLNPIENPILIKKSVAAEWISQGVGKMSMRQATKILTMNLPRIMHAQPHLKDGYEYWIWDPILVGANLKRDDGSGDFYVIDRASTYEAVAVAKVTNKQFHTESPLSYPLMFY